MILAHANNTLYALGSKNFPRTYVMTVVPLNTTTLPNGLTTTPPPTIKTLDVDIEEDCELADSQTTMHSDQAGALYILCFVSLMVIHLLHPRSMVLGVHFITRLNYVCFCAGNRQKNLLSSSTGSMGDQRSFLGNCLRNMGHIIGGLRSPMSMDLPPPGHTLPRGIGVSTK